jgi:hypothetical protein
MDERRRGERRDTRRAYVLVLMMPPPPPPESVSMIDVIILLYGVPVSTKVQATVVRYTFFVVTGIVIILIPTLE